MKIEIKSRWDSTVLFTAEAASLLLALEAAVKSGANLYGANLYGANLYGANLTRANLYGANLYGANLYGANLYGANLTRANLDGANLDGANLYGANLTRANLYGANLTRANLTRANLDGANLTRANLYGANLDGANLDGANLYGANLDGAINGKLAEALTIIIPEGNLVGWKKCQNDVIVKVLIPQKALRSNAAGRKCRAEFVKVLRVFGAAEGVSIHDSKTTYRKGEIVKCDNWNENRWVECGGGIHFYLTRLEAENN